MKLNFIFIPCRKGSKSIKNKNHQIIGGKPLILWTLEECFKVAKFLTNKETFYHVVVYTNDPEVKTLVNQLKADKQTEFVSALTRSEEVSTDESSTETTIHEFIKFSKPFDNLILGRLFVMLYL